MDPLSAETRSRLTNASKIGTITLLKDVKTYAPVDYFPSSDMIDDPQFVSIFSMILLKTSY